MVRLSKITKSLLAILLIAGSLSLTSHLTHQPVIELVMENAYAANGDIAAAATTTKTPPAIREALSYEKLLDTVARLSTYTNRIFNPFIFFFSSKIGYLLNNDYIFAGEMGTMLKSIWIASRNIVNILFVLILLFLAVRHIFGGDDNTDLKKALPKFVIVLIAVNFSWLAGKVVLDAANVATNVVFQIPAGVKNIAGESAIKPCKLNNTSTDFAEESGPCVSTQFIMNTKSSKISNFITSENSQEPPPANNDNSGVCYSPEKAKNYAKKNKTTVICWDTMDISKFKANNASMYLTYSIARVQKLVRGTSEDVDDITIGVIFAFIIQLIYVVAFACLFLALVLRVAALWILMAFSPFLVLIYYLKDINISIEESALSLQSFISWAFAPTKVAAVFSVGFLMLHAGQKADFDKAITELNIKLGTDFVNVQALFTGMDNIRQVIWLLMTVMIIWIGTFSVLTKLKAGSAIFEKINGYGKNLATEVAKSPTWAPIMPMIDPNTGKLRLGSYAKEYGGMDPLKALRGYKEKTIGEDAVMRYQKGINKFKSSSDSANLQRKLVELAGVKTDEGQKKLAEWFSQQSGIRYKDITVDEGAKLRDALRDIGGGAEAHAEAILNGAKAIEKGLATKPIQ